MSVVGSIREKRWSVDPDVGGRVIRAPWLDPQIKRTTGRGRIWLGPLDLDSTDAGVCLDVVVGDSDKDSPQGVNGYLASGQCVWTSLEEGYQPNELVIVDCAIDGSCYENAAVFSCRRWD